MPVVTQTRPHGGAGDGPTKTLFRRNPNPTNAKPKPEPKKGFKMTKPPTVLEKGKRTTTTTTGGHDNEVLKFKVGPDFIDEDYFECTPVPLYEHIVPIPDYKAAFERIADELHLAPVKPQPALEWDPNLTDLDEYCFLEELGKLQDFPQSKFVYMLPPQSRQDFVKWKLVKIFKPSGDFCVNTRIYIDLVETPTTFLVEIKGSLVQGQEEILAPVEESNELYVQMVFRHSNWELFVNDATQTFENFKVDKYTDQRIQGCADSGTECHSFQIVNAYRTAASDNLHRQIRENDDLLVGFFVEKARQNELTERLLVEKARQDKFTEELFATKIRLDELKAGLMAARQAQEDSPGCGGYTGSALPPEKARIENLTAALLAENARQQDMEKELIAAKARQDELTQGLLPERAKDMFSRLLADKTRKDNQPGGIFYPKPTLEELMKGLKSGKSKEEKLLLVEKSRQDDLTKGLLAGKACHDGITDGILTAKILQDELDELLIQKAEKDEDEDLIRRVEFTRYKDEDDIREFLMEEASEDDVPMSSEEDDEFEVRLPLKDVYKRKKRRAKHGLRLLPDISGSIPPLEKVIFADVIPEPEPEEVIVDCPLELSIAAQKPLSIFNKP